MANKSQVKKECRRCFSIKSITDFGPARNTRDKIQVWCKDCRRQHARDRYKKNQADMDAKRVQLYFDQKAKKASLQAHLNASQEPDDPDTTTETVGPEENDLV